MSDYFDLGDHTRKITTSSPHAQTWFDRGLAWCFGFNHDEAVRCFERALQHDPSCAMAHWGVALASGPFYNKPWKFFGPDELGPALGTCGVSADRAAELGASGTPGEQLLVEALCRRYEFRNMSTQEEFDRSDTVYAEAMLAAHHELPEDDDIAALAAEALITRTPWQLWDTESGEPARGADTQVAISLIEEALAAGNAADRPPHPGLCHMYLHALEMSPYPERALPVADHLRGFSPDSGHLNHMPGHIDVLCGRYEEAVAASDLAVAADARYLDGADEPGFYVSACAHDWHLMMYSAMFLAHHSKAAEAARGLEALLPAEMLEVGEPHLRSTLEAYFSMRIHVPVRFGRWDELIAEPVPRDNELYQVTITMLHYAKAIAHATRGAERHAQVHRAEFHKCVADIDINRRFFNNAAIDVLGVAEAMLEGELAYRSTSFDEAFVWLREAVRRDDSLHYTEPWAWMHPPRHALGALLLEQGHVDEATSVYRADLGMDSSLRRPLQHPSNVWSLHGLVECLDRSGGGEEAAALRVELAAAQQLTDVEVNASCACRLDIV
jgi:tetratricopeptide (TPR) repeat protein